MLANPYRGYRFPEEITSHAVFQLPLSLPDVELVMVFRGVQLSYETIRRWCDKFGKPYADQLRRQRRKLGDDWHLDEVFVKINGITHYFWRAVDQNGIVLDILVQPKRDRFAAIRFFRKLLRVLDTNRSSLLLTNCAPTALRNVWCCPALLIDSIGI